MNKEEFLKDAKLFLGQYAEKVAETLGYLKSNLETDEKNFRQQRGGWYAEDVLKERIEERKLRKEILIKKLARLDEVRLAL
jgi:hypothetical protein